MYRRSGDAYRVCTGTPRDEDAQCSDSLRLGLGSGLGLGLGLGLGVSQGDLPQKFHVVASALEDPIGPSGTPPVTRFDLAAARFAGFDGVLEVPIRVRVRVRVRVLMASSRSHAVSHSSIHLALALRCSTRACFTRLCSKQSPL